ncbi:MAG: hypothetical protein NC114_11545 [Ruminococcus flavefaciens]|nr:hypothetical protein [Ruminococcus flavefaciens]
MELIDSQILKEIVESYKINAAGLLPELVKRLILSSVKNISTIRFPSMNDVWAPGFDGVVECDEGNTHIKPGFSVWECGINHNSLQKVNSDYDKRNNDPLGIDKSKTSLYMVVPYIWKNRISKQQWENERKGEWANVHIVDAVELCDWLNSEPAVVCWLLENYSSKVLSFSSVSKAWEKFSHKTEPNFVMDMFIRGRGEKVELLNNFVKKDIIRVKSQSHIDAVGFVLAATLTNKEKGETYIVIDNEKTYNEINKIVKNKTFIFTFKYESDIISENNNRVILCFNCEDTSIKPDIELNKLFGQMFENALEQMGIKGIEATRLSKFTDRNPYILLRHIPGTANETCPKWAKSGNLTPLIPILFMRNVNKNNDLHREIIEKLGVKYQDFEDRMRELLRYEDSPIKSIGSHYAIINYEDIWTEMRLSVSDRWYASLVEIIKAIISSLSISNSIYSPISGNIFNNLLMNFVYFSNNCEQDRQRVVNDISSIIMLMKDKKCQYLLIKNLTTFAKAAPSVVLDFIQNDLKQKNGIITPLFENQTGFNEYCNILWALECLTQFNSTKVDACRILKDLYLRNYEYRIVNSPMETLSSALNILIPHNALTLNEKKGLLLSFIDENPIEMSAFALDLIGNNISARSVSIEDYPKDICQEEITCGDIYKAIERITQKIADIILEQKSSQLLEKFIKSYKIIYPKILDKLTDNIVYEEFDAEQLNKIYFDVLKTIRLVKLSAKHNKRSADKQILALKKFSDKIQNPDMFTRFALFFRSWWSCPIIIEDDMDIDEYYEKSETIILDYRKTMYLQLKQLYGEDVIYRLLSIMDDNACWGNFIFSMERTRSIRNICIKCVELSKFNILAAIMDRVELSEFESVFKLLDSEVQLKILPSIYRNDILCLLNEETFRRAYWCSKRMFVYDEEIYNNLLKYNPLGLLGFYYNKPVDKDNIEQIIKVCKQILLIDITQINRAIEYYYFSSVFDKIDNYIYTDEIAEIEFEFYRKQLIKDYTEGMKTYLFLRPFEIINVLNDKTEERLRASLWLNFHYTLPKIAYEDFDKYIFFFDSIVNKVEDKEYALCFVGEVIGRSVAGSDDIFPHEFARRVIEKYSGDKFDSGFIAGKNNMRMRCVGDGSDQLRIAQKYENDASVIRIEYPNTARLLEKLGKNHRHEAESDKVFSEIDVLYD